MNNERQIPRDWVLRSIKKQQTPYHVRSASTPAAQTYVPTWGSRGVICVGRTFSHTILHHLFHRVSRALSRKILVKSQINALQGVRVLVFFFFLRLRRYSRIIISNDTRVQKMESHRKRIGVFIWTESIRRWSESICFLLRRLAFLLFPVQPACLHAYYLFSLTSRLSNKFIKWKGVGSRLSEGTKKEFALPTCHWWCPCCAITNEQHKKIKVTAAGCWSASFMRMCPLAHVKPALPCPSNWFTLRRWQSAQAAKMIEGKNIRCVCALG